MLFIKKTLSACNTCYRHTPAVVYEENNMIMMDKYCETHGLMTSVVEIDPKFYYETHHHQHIPTNNILFEATDKCQLECPHCYHLPNNKKIDRSIQNIVEQIQSFHEKSQVSIAGAEPTLRTDFVELCREIDKVRKNFFLLTNGIKFADKKFAENCYYAGLRYVMVGLNHPNYQGERVHNKQLKAIKNLLDIGYTILYVGYTIQSLNEIPFIIDEIEKLQHPMIENFRIRCGSFIGRSNDLQRSYLSSTIKYAKTLRFGNELEYLNFDNNIYHITAKWRDSSVRLIQWPDITNMDLDELNCSPWCNFIDGPITNFVHQVIMRDAFKNNNLPQLDFAPKKYQFWVPGVDDVKYWKDDWTGVQKINETSLTLLT